MNHWRGAAACCVNENHEILMVLQGKPDEEFKWAVPSGGVEPGETLEECCVREVWEETGYKVQVAEKLFDKRGESYGWRIEVQYFLVNILSGAACIQDPDGLIHEVAWKSRADILNLDLSFPEDRQFLLDLSSGSLRPVYRSPKHAIAVSALVKNDRDEVLLVKTHWRSDTWEFPGGNVEEGESLDAAIAREVLEETGIIIRPVGVSGVYYNATGTLLNVVFVSEMVGGELRIQPEEIMEAKFVQLVESNIGQYITRPHMRSRSLDALKHKGFVPYECWITEPFQRISRLDPNDVNSTQ